MNRSSGAALVFILVSGACDAVVEAVDPCASGPPACEHTGGFDRTLASLAVQGGTEMGGTTYVGQGDSITLDYRIVNRGDRNAPPTRLNACLVAGATQRCGVDGQFNKVLEIGELRPGAEQNGTVRLGVSATYRGEAYGRAELMDADAVVSNDHLAEAFEVERPDLVVEVTPAASEWKVGELAQIRVATRNRAIAARSPESATELCLARSPTAVRGSFSACFTGVERSNSVVPVLGAGQIHVDTVEIVLPITGVLSKDIRGEDAYIAACADWAEVIDDAVRTNDCATERISLLPNLERLCSVEALPAGQDVNGIFEATDCDLGGVGDDVDVYSYVASPNTSYQIDLLAGYVALTVATKRGSVVVDARWLDAGRNLSFTTASTVEYWLILERRRSESGYRFKLTRS